MNPSVTSRRPAAASASITRRHASAVVASGFSHSTGLPAAMQASTNSSWVASNDATTTRSTASSAISACGSAKARPPPSSAAAEARAGSASATAATRAPLDRLGERPHVVGAHHPRADDADADGLHDAHQDAVGKCMCDGSRASSGQRLVTTLPRV